MKRNHQKGKLLPRMDRMRFDADMAIMTVPCRAHWAQDVIMVASLPFWRVYQLPEGRVRRQALIAWLRYADETPGHPRSIPVNNRWQANLADPDLQYLLKKGVLTLVRGGGGRRHPMNRSSAKRQTLLFLTEHLAKRQAYVFQGKNAT